MRRVGLFLAAVLVLVTSGCAQGVQVDVQAEEAAIREATVEYVEAWVAEDIERVLSLFTDDAAIIPKP